MALTPKQARFVQEYLIDLNATQAAVRAGYSERTANRTGSENLSKPDIQAALQTAMQARQARTEVTQDYVIGKLVEIADKAASDCQDSDLKYSNKIKALELLGKHVGAFERPEGSREDETQAGCMALPEVADDG